MAPLVQAIAAYLRHIAHARSLDVGELTKRLSVGTLGMVPLAQMILRELDRQVLLRSRRAVKVRLPGVGLIGHDLRLDGTTYPQFRFGRGRVLRVGLVDVDAFQGEITRSEMVGVPLEGYKARWDAEHPGDPMVMSVGGERAA